ncbi:MAG TPA: hypothetical protein VFJ85_15140 [Acidimicrobiales bacterium]|nr:hypothetical protein [Acidimicrobiales bacterium]
MNASAVWTGSEFIVWGGSVGRTPFVDGAAYDPRTRTWRAVPAAPIAPRTQHAAVWTGREMLVVGGTSRRGNAATFADGAAYDPAAGTWRRIADAPAVTAAGKAVVVGGFVVVSGREGPTPDPRHLLVYDLAADRWTAVPAGVEVADLAAAGSGVAVAGRQARFAFVAIPDGSVQLLPDLPLRRHELLDLQYAVAWTGSEVLAFAGRDHTVVGAWRPGRRSWSATTTVRSDHLQVRSGDNWHEAGAVAWHRGWVVSAGISNFYAAAPATGLSAALSEAVRRLCPGDAAIAFSDDAVFVWGGTECHPGPNLTGAMGAGTLIRLESR